MIYMSSLYFAFDQLNLLSYLNITFLVIVNFNSAYKKNTVHHKLLNRHLYQDLLDALIHKNTVNSLEY